MHTHTHTRAHTHPLTHTHMQDAVRAGKDPCVWKMKLMGEGDKIRQQASTFSSVKHKGTPAPVCPACTHSSPASSQKKKKSEVKRKGARMTICVSGLTC